MGRLLLLIVFYWVLLLENGTGIFNFILELGNGLEIRPSLVVKVALLFVNILVLVHFDKNHKIPKYLIILSSFLLFSTLLVLLINPSNFISALSVNLHIQLMLNIILFIRINTYSNKQLLVFFRHLRYFALANAILVIISYFSPFLFSGFEVFNPESDVPRAFGIMDDEVSVFLTFFLFEALISKRYLQLILYAFAILFTGSLGASFTIVILVIAYLVFAMKKTKLNLYIVSGLMLIILSTSIVFYNSYKDFGIFQRLSNLSENTNEKSASLRLLSFQVAYEMIRERPVFGYGYGNYGKSVINKYKPKFIEVGEGKKFDGSARIIMSYTFNPFLQIAAESGLVGLIFFIWFLVKIIGSTFIKFEDRLSDAYHLNLASRIWLIVFILTTLSANWFLPSSFLLLLVVSIVGMNEKLKILQIEKYPEETL